MTDVEAMIAGGLLCEGCCVIIDGEEPGFRRMCPRCKGEHRERRARRHGPVLGAAAHPEPELPELVDLDAEELELADG